MTGERVDQDRLAQWLRLHLTQEVGSITFARLLAYFGSVDAALEASAGQLAQVSGIGEKTAWKIVESRGQVDVEGELKRAEELGVRIITLEDEEYPVALKEIHDPPAVLYVKGTLTRGDKLAIAIVGSRNASHYGQEQASRLACLLAAAGFTIVSGLARGIDTAAHRGAISGEGRTLAVQGCGLGMVFPPENKDLAKQIAAQGAILSELPLGFEPLSTTFPARNRIISGLSLATIVVEARPRSGALITARLAVEQNREVMAVPGRVDAPGSAGPHQLIKEGAKLVERVEDVLEALGPIGDMLADHVASAAQKTRDRVEPTLFETDPPALKLSEIEAAVLRQLDTEPAHIDELLGRIQATAGQANAALTGLQLKGLVKQLPGSYFQKRKSARS